MVKTDIPATLDPRLALSTEFVEAVVRHVDGVVSDNDTKMLQDNKKLWVRALYRLLDDIAESIDDVRIAVRGHQRALIINDLESEYKAVDAVLTRLIGPPQTHQQPDIVSKSTSKDSEPESITSRSKSDSVADTKISDTSTLQLSWMPGRIIAWAAAPNGNSETKQNVLKRLHRTGAATIDWEEYRRVKLDGDNRADSVATNLESCLGWLVALGETAKSKDIGVSVAWLGLVATLAVRLVAQGRIVPQLKKLRRIPAAASTRSVKTIQKAQNAVNNNTNRIASTAQEKTKSKVGRAGFMMHWVPVLVESEKLDNLAKSLPGAAAAFENQRDVRAFTQAVLADIVNAIVTQATSRIDTAAPPPVLHTRADVAEKALAQIDGTPFAGPLRYGMDLGRHLERWYRPVRKPLDNNIVIKLTPPDITDSWQLSVLAESNEGQLQPVERALTSTSQEQNAEVKHQLIRLERLCPDLIRLGGRRRGEVFLNSDEAWRLMTETGPMLETCGYELRFPDLSHHRPAPALRITALDATDSAVGADQLANVRWSAVFGDVELSVEDIRNLAQESRPLLKTRGRWMELDRTDLNATMQALEERTSTTHMTGVDMLRHALGLEQSLLDQPTTIAGRGWAVDLIRSAKEIPDELPTKPDGFAGQLRNYQAEALVWLQFLGKVGLGGCLALDMGLGKTPIMLAHIQLTRSNGTSLVIAPPAVVGNWQSEAHNFVPEMQVAVHHGPNRCSADTMPKMVEEVDLVITTYGTVLRDIEMLEKVEWATVVADEAQAIKNHTSETARHLRRISARSRITLTGTPIENGLGDLWSIIDFCNPGLLGSRSYFINAMNALTEFNRSRTHPAMTDEIGVGETNITTQELITAKTYPTANDSNEHSNLQATEEKTGTYATHGDASVFSADTTSKMNIQDDGRTNRDTNEHSDNSDFNRRENTAHNLTTNAHFREVPNSDTTTGEGALAVLNGLLIFRRTKSEPLIASELPDRIDEIDYCTMTREQIGLYQAVLDQLAIDTAESDSNTQRKGVVLAAITALKQICNHPINYRDDSAGIAGRSGKLARLEEIIEQVFSAKEKMLIFTHFASWGEKLAGYLSELTESGIECYHGGLARGARDRMVARFQKKQGADALVLSLKAGGIGLNLTAANHVVLYDRWWNPAVEDQARDRAWRIGQRNTVICHRLVCPGTIDERVEMVVAGKRYIADMVLPKSSSIGDLDGEQLQTALGIDSDQLLIDENN